MTQTFRSRDEQIEQMFISYGQIHNQCVRDWILRHILEAEARGAAEERGKGTDGRPIHIVFAGEPGPGTLHFVEVEDGKGNNIPVGEWVKRPDGLMDLVIPAHSSALEADRDKWRLQAHYETDVAQVAIDRGKTLEARVKELEKALGFYADPNNYIDSGFFEGDPDLVTPKAIPVLQHGEDGSPCDCGDTARAALKRGGWV